MVKTQKTEVVFFKFLCDLSEEILFFFVSLCQWSSWKRERIEIAFDLTEEKR